MSASGKRIEQRLHHRLERGEVIGHGDGLGQRLAVAREQRSGGVERFLDDGREGAADDGHLHLGGDAVDLVAHDLERDGIEGAAGLQILHDDTFSSSRLPSLQTRAVHPGSSERRGVGLLDHGRAVDDGARDQRCARIDCRPRPAAPTPQHGSGACPCGLRPMPACRSMETARRRAWPDARCAG